LLFVKFASDLFQIEISHRKDELIDKSEEAELDVALKKKQRNCD
jgi:hypothetical protein